MVQIKPPFKPVVSIEGMPQNRKFPVCTKVELFSFGQFVQAAVKIGTIYIYIYIYISIYITGISFCQINWRILQLNKSEIGTTNLPQCQVPV